MVVLLILAGVAISIVVSPDGLFTKSEQAKTDWNAKVDEEQIKIDEALGYLPGSSPSDLPEGWESSKVAEVVEEGTRKAPIPVGYTKSGITSEINADSPEDTIAGGLVVYQIPTGATVDWENNQITLSGATTPVNLQENVNQYVWIPVDDINDMVMCKSNGSNKKIDGETATEGEKTTCELVYDVANNKITCTVHGYDTTVTELTDTNIDTTGLAGRLYATDTNTSTTPYTTNMAFTQASKDAHRFKANSTSNDSKYREPDLVTSYDNSNYGLVLNESSQALGSANALKHQLNDKFIEMARSVAKYGGFYVSRYEAGANGASLKNQKVLVAGTSSYPGSNADTYINGNKWYGMYNTLMSSTAIDKTAVNSHMIWGCQYDQIINFLSENSINEPQIGHTARQLNAQKLTGETSTDIMSNIYDLEGNNVEWTAQAYNTSSRVYRGGNFGTVSSNSGFFPASFRVSYSPTGTNCYYASRSVLCVK